ncbi:MAG: hypothetical protein AAF211_26650, partial [Myxococcota bacterium]
SAYIIGVGIALRWIIPWLDAELQAASGFDVGPYLPVGVSYFVLVNASVLTGMVGGFLLLEQREERTIKAFLVTPTPLGVNLGVLSGLVLVSGAALSIVEGLIVGHGVPDLVPLVVSSVLCAPTGLMMGLVLATVADNKVEAFAVMKITSAFGIVPVVAWFLPMPLQYVAGVLPPYWACRIWWVAAEGSADWTWMVVPAVLTSAGWLAWLGQRFQTAVRR